MNPHSVSQTNTKENVSKLLLRSGRNPDLSFAVIGDAATALALEETRDDVELSPDAVVFDCPLDMVFEETYSDADLSPDVFSLKASKREPTSCKLWWCPWHRVSVFASGGTKHRCCGRSQSSCRSRSD